jgi:hypothetical protein
MDRVKQGRRRRGAALCVAVILLAACQRSDRAADAAPVPVPPAPPPVSGPPDYPPVDNSPPPENGDSLDAAVLADVPTFESCDFLDNHYCQFPWPSDWLTVADSGTATGRRVNLDVLTMPRNILGKPLDPTEWNRNDGFSPGQALLVRVEGLDMAQSGAVPLTDIGASYRADQPIVVIDAGPANPVDPAFKPKRHLIWSELDANITKFGVCDTERLTTTLLALSEEVDAPADELRAMLEPLFEACRALPLPENPLADPGPALIIRPAVNFTPGHRYIVALRGLKDSGGAAIEPGAAFRIYRDNHTTDLPMVEGRRAHMEDLFATLGRAGVARSDLYLAWDFTVASERNLGERVLHIRNDALAQLGDDTPGDGIVQGGAPVITDLTVADRVGDQNIAREVRGVIEVPSYLNIPFGPAGSRFWYTPDASGLYGDGLPDQNPLQPTQTFDFLCRIPRRAFNGAQDPPTASAGTPQRPALYGHGLLGSKGEGSGQVGAIIEGIGMIYCATDWIGMASHEGTNLNGIDTVYYDPPAGDVPNVLSLLIDMSNFATLTDRVQQSLVNFTYLGRAILAADGFCAHPEFRVGDTCLIDRSELYYDGNSQGGIIGGALTAMSPDIRKATLGVPGMNYSTLLRRSVDFDLYAAFFYSSYQGSLDQSFIISLIQMLWDRAENNGYAHHLRQENPMPETPPKQVLLHPAFGDHQVTMWSAEVMARSIGAGVHCPAVVGGADTSQRGPALYPGINPSVTAEAQAAPAISFNRRHPDDEPYYAIPCISAYPHSGNALVVWDSGPLVRADGTPRNDDGDRLSGVAPPPIDNTPPRPELGYGADPHEYPRTTEASRQQKDAFYRPGGAIVDTCGGKPCSARGFDPDH